MTSIRKDGPITIFHDPINQKYILRCWECQSAERFDQYSDAVQAYNDHTHQES